MHYSRLIPWRGKDKNVRPLDKHNRKHHREVRMGSEQELIFKYHNTDCVIYYPDGRVRINHGGWQTKTTAEFLCRFAPSDIGVALRANSEHLAIIVTNWVASSGYWHGENTAYQFDGNVTIKRDENGVWVPLPGETVPFKKYRVNTKVLNEVMCEEGYDDFVTWFKAVRSTGGIKEPERRGWGRKASGWPNRMYIREVLSKIEAGKDSWIEVYEDQGPRLLEKLRHHVAVQHGCVTITEYESMSFKEGALAQKSEHRLT